MKIKKAIPYLVGSFLAIFAACKKPDNGPVLTPGQLTLTNHIWRLQSLTVPQIHDPSIDSTILSPCSDSALMAFDAYEDFQLFDGSKNGCDSVAIPYEVGHWKLSSNNDSLILTGNRNFVWKLEKLNDTIVKATFRDSTSPSKNWLKKITLKL